MKLSGPSRQGAALVCALVLMLATMLVGVSICRTVFASMASSRAERERGIAREAAEAALRDAEHDIAGADAVRATLFSAGGAGAFVDGCGRGGNTRGLCLATSPPAWQHLDLAQADHPALVPYGYYTGAGMGTGLGLLSARLPAYLIERIVPPGATPEMGGFYLVTAVGFGSRATTRVVLQSVVRKPPPAGAGPPPPPLPAGRIGWREIGNWPQLHAAATGG